MRLWSQGGSKTILTFDLADARHGGDGVLDPARHLAGHRAARRRQRHVDGDIAVVVDVDLVDQAQLVDVDRDFRVVRRSSAPRRCRPSAARAPRAAEPRRIAARRAPSAAASASADALSAARRVDGSVAFASLESSHPFGISLGEQLMRLGSASTSASTSSSRVVHGERGAAGGRDAEALHQRLRAMGAGAHRDARAVDDGRNVVGMQPLHREGDDRALVLGAAEDAAAKASSPRRSMA